MLLRGSPVTGSTYGSIAARLPGLLGLLSAALTSLRSLSSVHHKTCRAAWQCRQEAQHGGAESHATGSDSCWSRYAVYAQFLVTTGLSDTVLLCAPYS